MPDWNRIDRLAALATALTSKGDEHLGQLLQEVLPWARMVLQLKKSRAVDDALQEVARRIVEYRTRYDSTRGSYKYYLSIVIRNVVIDEYRRPDKTASARVGSDGRR